MRNVKEGKRGEWTEYVHPHSLSLLSRLVHPPSHPRHHFEFLSTSRSCRIPIPRGLVACPCTSVLTSNKKGRSVVYGAPRAHRVSICEKAAEGNGGERRGGVSKWVVIARKLNRGEHAPWEWRSLFRDRHSTHFPAKSCEPSCESRGPNCESRLPKL